MFMQKTKLATTFIVAFLLLALVGTLHLGTVQASTDVTGIIFSDTTWTKADSPYILKGPVAVNGGVTLTIEAGVQVNLTSYYIQVNGTLVARGTNAEKIDLNDGEIIFMEDSNGWNEQTSSGSIIENVRFSGKITLRNASPKIRDNIGGQLVIEGASPSISNSNLGLTIYSGSPFIINNNIRGPVSIVSGSPVISQNIISNGITFKNYSSSDIPNLADTPVITNNYISSWDVLIKLCGCSAIVSSNTIVGLSKDFGSRQGYFGEMYGVYSANYGIFFDGGTASIINNTITNCTVGICIAAGNATIERNLIYKCTEGMNVGTETGGNGNLGKQVAIQKNTVAHSITAITLFKAHQTAINHNNIQNYSQSIYLKSTANDIDATNNWWGTTNEILISQSIFDYKNDFNLGKVNYTPVLTEPDPNAPAISEPTPMSSSSSSSPPPSSSPSSSQSPTSMPNAQSEADQQGFNWTEISLIAALGVIAALLVVITFMNRKQTKK